MTSVTLGDMRLEGFRIHAHFEQNWGGKSWVICGKNGSGKTSLLEAMSYFVAPRGMKGFPLSEAMSWGRSVGGGGHGCFVEGTLSTPSGEGMLRTGLAPTLQGGRRFVRYEEERLTFEKVGELLPLVWFLPEMDHLFIHGRAPRRDFFDRFVGAIFPAHGQDLEMYARDMAERQRVLLQGADGRWLNILEARLAPVAGRLFRRRQEVAQKIAPSLAALTASTRLGFLELSFEGTVEQGAATLSPEEIDEMILCELYSARERDMQAKRSTFGPHRTRLCLSGRQRGVDVAHLSVGEQKLGLMLLFLSLVMEMKAQGRPPLLLMDDIFSYLDGGVVPYVLTCLESLHLQTFITALDPQPLIEGWQTLALTS